MATPASRRKVWIAALGASLLVLFVALATLNAFNTQLPKPASTQQIVIFTGLSIVAFLLFVAVLILLVRNVLKLYADQRSRVMGTRLRTRMLWGAVLVSLIPIVSMFAFSYLLINRAVDRWFSQPVTEMRDDTNNMAARTGPLHHLQRPRRSGLDRFGITRDAASSVRKQGAGRPISSRFNSPPSQANPCRGTNLRAQRRSHHGALRLSPASRSHLSGVAPARDHPAERLRHRLSRGTCPGIVPDAAAHRSHRAG